jgi:integrase
LPTPIVAILQALKAQARPNDTDRVFVSFSKWINTAALLREDLATAGIEPIDKDGNDIFFHSLRNSYISYLASSQTPVKVIQKLARHSDPRLTFNTYVRTFDEAEQKAVTFLPNFGEFCLVHLLGQNVQKTGDLHRQP